MPVARIFSFRGDKELDAALAGLAREIREKAIERALRRGGAIVIARAQVHLIINGSVATGLLFRALGLVLRGRRSHAPYVVLGARNSVSGVGPDGRVRKPANYAHLVELGHFAVQPIAGTSRRKSTAKGVRYVPGKPFLEPALVGARAEVRLEFIKVISAAQSAYLKRTVKLVPKAA